MQRVGLPNEPWRLSSQEVLKKLDVLPDRGLGAGEVNRRRKRYGPNHLREAAQKSAWLILADQFKSLIILLRAVASGSSICKEPKYDISPIPHKSLAEYIRW
jgi:magnesium-transporting ATPase (P-type)